MKWFKHYSDMHDGETIAELFEHLGHKGLAFFLLQELCCEKLEKNKDQFLQESDCIFRFPVRIVRQKLRLSGANLAELLRICATKGQLSYLFDENILEIKMPILLYLLDSDSKKARQKRAEAATQSRLDKDKEEDKDKEQDISTEPKKSVAVVAAKKPTLHISLISKDVPISVDLVKSWADTYPKEYLEMELKKARSWLITNPHKQPKSNYGRFFNSWFDRGWEKYRQTLKSNPTQITVEDLEAILKKDAE